MQLSSLTSIIAAAINAFTSESTSDSSDKFHLKQDLFGYDYYMTFYQNDGPAEVCTAIVSGYRTFEAIGSTEYADLIVSNMPGDDTYLCISESWSPNQSTTAYNITLCADQSDQTPIPFDLTSDSSNVSVEINNSPYYFFVGDSVGFDCRYLTLAANGANLGGDWTQYAFIYDN